MFSHLTPWQIFLRSWLGCFLLGCILFGTTLERIERFPLDGAPLQFDAKNAHALMTKLSTSFPNRLPWREERRQAGKWIEEQFRSYGYTPKDMTFSEVIGGVRYTDLRNIYAEKRGTEKPDEIVLVLGHYDTTDTTIEGAMDDASGVAVMLELARIFSKIPTKRTLVFLATDSEEFGAFWGATQFAKYYERKDQIIGAASFDFVANHNQVRIVTLCDGLRSGFTPLWLRELALDSVRSIPGVEALDFQHVVEFVSRAMQIPAADHGALLAAGIPAFNWVGQNEDFGNQMAQYHHTPDDRAEFMKVESFETYGKAAEKFVRSIDAIHAVPADFRNSNYLKITSQHYLKGWVVLLLHCLLFVPFIFYALNKFGRMLRNHSRSEIVMVLKNEAKNFGILFGSLMIGYVVMRLLPALRMIGQYEGYPATQKSALLYNPNFLAILVVLASIALVYFFIRKMFAERTDSSHYGEIRHAFHAFFLLVLIILAMAANSSLAVLLLGPPAYFWTFIRSRKKRNTGDRIYNVLLLLGGSITFLIMVVVMSTIFHVGIVYWYLFLSAAYGLFSVYAVVLFLLALATMIRLFRSSVI